MDKIQKLRQLFIKATQGEFRSGPYWKDLEELRLYDESLGKRILWKWEAVFREFPVLGLETPQGKVLDFGCGAGVVGEALSTSFPDFSPTEFFISDHSSLALKYTQEKLQKWNPKILENGSTQSWDWVFVSHVLNELNDHSRLQLLNILKRSRNVFFVEPGTLKDFQKLAWLRESLRSEFTVLAPCTHSNVCPLEKSSKDWCHHFAEVPSVAFQSREWSQIQKDLKIDLSSLPYSYLLLSRDNKSSALNRKSRLLGSVQQLKASSKLLVCDSQSGVRELELFKRDNPALYKALKKGHVKGLIEAEVDAATGRLRSIKI